MQSGSKRREQQASQWGGRQKWLLSYMFLCRPSGPRCPAVPPPSLPTVANASRNCLKTRNPSSRPSPGVDCCLLRSTVMHAPHASCVISAQFSPRDASCVAGKPASRSFFFFSPNASKSTAFDAPGRADFKSVSLFSRTLRVRWEFSLHRFWRLPANGLRADMGPFSSRTPRVVRGGRDLRSRCMFVAACDKSD